MYENFFPCINPEMMRCTGKFPYNNINNNPDNNTKHNNTNSNTHSNSHSNAHSNTKSNTNSSNMVNNVKVDSSGCGSNPMNLELARAYMPIQPYVGLLPLNEGLKRGSIFPNINLKYPRI